MNNDFDQCDKKVHKIETQWHYAMMIAAGFTPLNTEATGFVRSFKYQKDDLTITCNTGFSSDHWGSSAGDFGYWCSLEAYIQ